MRVLQRSFPVPLLLLLTGTASAGTGVLVVDAANGPGADFTDLQPAVDAASEGDVLLVRSGVYGGAAIVDKSLTLAAEAGATVETTATVSIEDLALGKSVSISGFTMRSEGFGASFVAQDCAGAVLVQDSVIRVIDTGTLVSGDAGQILACSAVSLVRCDVQGESDQTPFLTGSGLWIVDSDVALHDSTVTGPEGMQGDPGSGQAGFTGGPGLSLTGGTLALYGTSVTGGVGGKGGLLEPFGLCSDGGTGGAALFFFASKLTGDPLVRHTGSVLSGGPGGTAELGCAPGGPGVATQGTGTLVELPVAPRSYTATSPIADGEAFLSTYAGEEGDFVFGLYSLDAFPTPFVFEANGGFWPSLFTAQLTTVGVLPASGTANTSFTVSFAGTGAEVFVQGIFLEPGGAVALSNPQSILFLAAER